MSDSTIVMFASIVCGHQNITSPPPQLSSDIDNIDPWINHGFSFGHYISRKSIEIATIALNGFEHFAESKLH